MSSKLQWQEISACLDYIHPNNDVFEICVIGPQIQKSPLWQGFAKGDKPIISGWFSDRKIAAETILALDQQVRPEGIYTTLNPCNPALLARANNRLIANISRTKDSDIVCIRNILVDIDPQRPSGISSSDPELQAAWDLATLIKKNAMEYGWPEPLAGISGNGAHLLFKVNLNNSPGNITLVKNFLERLDAAYSTDTIKIDLTVYNPARISKVYGTMVRKGDNITERSHRRARIISLPHSPQVVPLQMLQALAAAAPEKEVASASKPSISPSGQKFDLSGYLNHYNVKVKKVIPHGDSTLHCLEECAFDSSHKKGEAKVGQTSDGKLFYRCFHNSCQNRTWAEFRQRISGDDKLTQSTPVTSKALVPISAPQLPVLITQQLLEAKTNIAEIIAIAQKSPKLVVDEIMKSQKYLDALAVVNIQEPQLFELAMSQLIQHGVLVKEVERIRKLIARLSKKKSKKQTIHNPNLMPVISKLQDAPVGQNILIPSAYEMDINGIAKVTWIEDRDGTLTEKRESVASAPILIIGRLLDIEDQGESIRLAWFRDNHWRDRIVERKIIATARDITVLANLGLPVTSLTANLLIEYLAEFESLNLAAIPLSRITAKLGWLPKMDAFLCGPTLITPANYAGETVTFQGMDEGDAQIARGFYQSGSFTVWVALANDLYPYHLVIAQLYFSLIPPFLKIFKADNFTVDLSFITSRGKTTSLRFGGSVWGNPNEKDRFSVVHTWAATLVWIGRALAICNDLPLPMDDTKTAGTGRRNNEDAAAKVSQTLYMVEKGRGRERGSIEGTKKTGSWNSLLMSTGEQAITDFTTGEGGSRARALVFWGAPFGKSNKTTADLVKRINRTVMENFGHAGPIVVKFILDHRSDWGLWLNAYKELQVHFSNRAGSNPVAIRLSNHLATLTTIIPIVHAALPDLRRDYPIKQIIDHLWVMAISGADDADRATAALNFAYTWAAANQTKFWGRHQDDSNNNPKEPIGGWAGVWEKNNWPYIGFTTQTLKKLLTDQGFDFEAVVRTWQDRNWLETEKKGRQKQVRIDNAKTYAYCTKKKVIENELGIFEN